MLRKRHHEEKGRFLVLGCGYVGSRLAKEAVQRGFQVTALTRSPEKLKTLGASGEIEVIGADLASDTWHSRIDPSPAAVVNCVASGGGGVAGYRRSYVEGMDSIARWLSRGGTATAVYTGSIGVYPQNDGGVVDESAETGGHSPYADLLLAAETRFLSPDFSAARRFVLRQAGIYGPGRHAFLNRILKGDERLPGRGNDIMNAIRVEDVCGAVWAAIEGSDEDAAEVYNVVDDCPTPRREVANWLSGRLNLPDPRFEENVSGSDRRARNRRIDNRRIKAAFGWTPRYPTFREGYEELLTALQR